MLLALAATALALVSAFTASAVAAADGQDRGGVTSVPVEFKVTIQNRAVPCAATPVPKAAVVRGTLTGPANALAQGKVAGALYSHGDGYDESFFNFPDQRYNVVDDLAKRGHVSVTIDRLGYGESDKPNGNGICYGHEADVLSQIIGQLRQGSYQAQTKPAFSRVALLGHSASGFIVEQEAGVFRDVDALGAISTGLEASTPLVTQRAGEQQTRCLTSPDGYAPLEANGAQFRADHIVNVEPKIADILTRNRTEDACAGARNLQTILTNSVTNAAAVKVPVLAIAGANDAFFPNVKAHAATFTASPKVTVRSIPNTGHAIAFARTAPQFRNELAAWLQANRF